MANWQRTLEISESWEKAQNHELPYHLLAADISNKLNALTPIPDEELEQERQDLIEAFDAMAEDDTVTKDEINSVMSDLYDWADAKMDSDWSGKKVCWINTLSAAA